MYGKGLLFGDGVRSGSGPGGVCVEDEKLRVSAKEVCCLVYVASLG